MNCFLTRITLPFGQIVLLWKGIPRGPISFALLDGGKFYHEAGTVLTFSLTLATGDNL